MKRALLVLLTCSVLAVSSCSASNETYTAVCPQRTLDNLSPHDAVVAALKKWTTVKSFRQRFTSTSGGTESSGSMEFVAPDRVHFVMNIAGEPFESITIGQTEYTKDVDGSWVKTTLEGGKMQGHLFADPRQIAQLADNVTDAQLTATENSEGTVMKVYTFKRKLPDTQGVYESQMWIAISDGLPRRIESKYDFMVEGLRQSGRSSIICSDYNSEIQIEPPIK